MFLNIQQYLQCILNVLLQNIAVCLAILNDIYYYKNKYLTKKFHRRNLMHSQETKVLPKSDYYVYAPSVLAKKLYLYPNSTGYFYYEVDYQIRRNRFDSFLLMYIAKGSCQITLPHETLTASAGQFVLIDCYQPHSYGSTIAWEASWLHFDGTLARDYFCEITEHYGNVLSPDDPITLNHYLEKICNMFRHSQPIMESKISSYITNILNALLLPPAYHKNSLNQATTIADSISYINENFQKDLPLKVLAGKANMSPFYFTRVFFEETGSTPHQYVINTRISAAKYLLKSTDASIKDIAFHIGFHSESSFCSTFKKWEDLTPSQYRDGFSPIL